MNFFLKKMLLMILFSIISAANTINIMPLGDSITYGFFGHSSYRYFLWKKFIDNNYNIDFVGMRHKNIALITPNYEGKIFDSDHNGFSGWQANHFNMWLNFILSQTKIPDIVLLHIGTNDKIFTNKSSTKTLNDISCIIEKLRAVNSNVKIVLAKIIPIAYPWINNKIIDYNSRLDDYAIKHSTIKSPIVIADQYNNYNPRFDSVFDGIHPNIHGERKMANVWFDALESNDFLNSSQDLQ